MLTTCVMAVFFTTQVELMGSENYKTREVAFRVLQEANDLAIPTVLANLKNHNLEIRRRCEILVNDYKASVLAAIKPTKYNFYPWIDCSEWIAQRSSEIEAEIIDKYCVHRGATTNFRTEYREATMDMVFDMHMAGLPKWRIVAVLDEMIAVEKKRMERNHLPFPYIPKSPTTSPKQLDKSPK
jgi:hypothetical protein